VILVSFTKYHPIRSLRLILHKSGALRSPPEPSSEFARFGFCDYKGSVWFGFGSIPISKVNLKVYQQHASTVGLFEHLLDSEALIIDEVELCRPFVVVISLPLTSAVVFVDLSLLTRFPWQYRRNRSTFCQQIYRQ